MRYNYAASLHYNNLNNSTAEATWMAWNIQANLIQMLLDININKVIVLNEIMINQCLAVQSTTNDSLGQPDLPLFRNINVIKLIASNETRVELLTNMKHFSL